MWASLAWRDLKANGGSLWVLCACLALGVTLIAASGGLYRTAHSVLLANVRLLLGGDLELESRAPLEEAIIEWMRRHGDVSLRIELRTMAGTAEGRFQLVELQVHDDHYPLYGSIELDPPIALDDALDHRDGHWGAAFDPLLAERLGVAIGDRLRIGAMEVELRARIAAQPDRGLSADWRGPPLLIAPVALDATGLVQPHSRVEYEYRVRTAMDPQRWRERFVEAFPDDDSEVRTFADRSRRIAEVFDQVASGMLLIGFSALFIGGLGVFNSVHGHLQGKLGTIATLRALGLRDHALAAVYLFEIGVMAAVASAAGALFGGLLAATGSMLVADRLPEAPLLTGLAVPLAGAFLFGVLAAMGFALPAVGRALSVPPAVLFRGIHASGMRTPACWWRATALVAPAAVGLVVWTVPDTRFAAGFLVVGAALLALLEAVQRVLRTLARRLAGERVLRGRLVARLALASLHRPGAALRPTLLSLGSALALLVASTMVVVALLRTIGETIPRDAPALVFHDIPASRLDAFRTLVESVPGVRRLRLAPLVLGRLSHVNGEPLRASDDPQRALKARDEHKFSYRSGDLDQVRIERGAWWPRDHDGPPLVAMEDHEADQLGLAVGDLLRFDFLGEPVAATLAAIYRQRTQQTRFWLEGIFSDGALDPWISRHVGAVHVEAQAVPVLHDRIAASYPEVVVVRTATVLDEARRLLGRAAVALAVIAAVTLSASLLVLASVVAANRIRHSYEASVLHTLGVRVSVLRRALALEYALLALLTSLFGVALGGTIAVVLLGMRLEPVTAVAWWPGVLAALAVSTASLALGAAWLLRRLRLSPALLLRAGG